MNCELEINGRNALSTWGVRLADGSLSALMTPPPMKEYIINESAAEHGRVLTEAEAALPKVDSRDLSLTLHIMAASKEQFYGRYHAFVEELQKGVVKVRTRYQEDVTYKLIYISCNQFSNFNGRLGKFVLRMNEPNPMKRDDND